jgi:hypothetical protein
MSSYAYLVGWIDTRQNRYIDAGIYSEKTPTSPRLQSVRSVVLLSAVSRFESSDGGFERAMESLHRLASLVPLHRWVLHARTYRFQRQSHERMKRERAILLGPAAHAR